MLFRLEDYWLRELDKTDKIIGKTKREVIDDTQYIEVEELLGIIENLNYEVERLEDEISELRQDIEDNYIQRKLEDDYSISERDFI